VTAMVSKQELLRAIDEARAKGYQVFGPVRRDGLVLLERVDDASSLDFDHVLTVNSLKDVLLPRNEVLANLELDTMRLATVEDDDAPIIIFGSRPCDAAGIGILDSILLGSISDARYQKRRERTTLVTLACSRCDDACFCTSMGYGPHDATSSDVLVLPAAGRFAVRAISAKGRSLLESIGLKADSGGTEGIDKPPELVRKLDAADLKAWLDENFASERWHAISENCVSCGTCYYLCPTCHCFDITDEAGLSRGERLRIWDCCSFAGFTKMAGHQPRVGRHARYRQRIMHKFSYCPTNSGKVACVGDGRCIRHCPYGVDICEAIEQLLAKG
jgi:sulfhydrogenase subunit beta (sulfur reductase)